MFKKIYAFLLCLFFFAQSIFPKDFGLRSAVNANAEGFVEMVFERHSHELSKKVVTESFADSFIKCKPDDFKLGIAQAFLRHPVIKEKLVSGVLDTALIKSILFSLDDIFLMILFDKSLCAKLYTCKRTRKFFNLALWYASKKNVCYLEIFLSDPACRDRFKHLRFLQPFLRATETPVNSPKIVRSDLKKKYFNFVFKRKLRAAQQNIK